MNERRLSLGNRVISLVLALVMVIGMMPAGVLSVFADTTGNPDVTSNADTILQYAQGKLDDNHDKTGAFTWDTEGKSDGWRYFNGVMLEAFLQNGLQASETETAYSFAQNYFDFYINDSGSTFDAVLNELVQEKYGSADSELDGVPPARNLAQLVGHVGFTDSKYTNAVKVLYSNTVGQEVVSNTGGNFIHKENNSSWANWKVGLDGIYMAQPFLMEVAKAVKEGRVDVGDTYTEIADGVYNRLYWIANNMKYQTSDNVYLYHHGWGPGDDYKNGNGITWSRGTGWWVAGLADCIALMEDIGYDSTKIATLKTYLKEAIDGLLKYQDDSGLWYNVIYVQDSGTTTSNNFLEVSGTGLFAYTIMKAYTRGWLTDAKYGQAALNAIDGIMGSSSYYSSGSFKNILKSSGVGTTVSYYNSDKSEDEAKGVGPIIMAASMYDDVKAMVSGGTKYTETFQIGAVNVTELPVMGTTVYANGLKATVVGSKGTIKDVTELTTQLDGDKVKVLYNGNLIATVDAVIISTDATSGTGSFTVADDATKPEGENTNASGTVDVTVSAGTTYTYTRYTGDSSTAAAGDKFIIVSADQTVALKNDTDGGTSKTSGKNTAVSFTDDTKKFAQISSTDADYAIWQLTDKSQSGNYNKFKFLNGSRYICGQTSADNILGTSSVKQFFIASAGTDGLYYLATGLNSDGTAKGNYFYHDGSNWVYVESPSDTERKGVYLYAVSTTEGGDGGTYEYTIKLDADQTGALIEKGNIATLSAVLSAARTEDTSVTATPTGSIVWSSSNSDVASVDSSTGVVTGVSAGDATITATVTGATVSGSEESVNLSVEIPVKVTEAATYSVTLTLEPGSLIGKVDETGSFTPTVVIKNANDEDVTATFADSITYNGTIADTSIAEVSNTGVITFKKAGYTTFTQSATVNGTTVTATGNILVQADEAEHIHSYTASEEITLAPTCNTAGSKKVYCSCGEYEVRTISATGAHTYVNGACSVCGTTDPSYVEPGIENIVAGSNTTGKATIQVDGTLQLTANTVGGASVTWSSSSDAIATVSDTGLVTGVSAGTVTITATVVTATRAVGDSATFEVTVTAADDSGNNPASGNIKDYTGNPSFTPGDYVEIVAPSTSTTGGSSTNHTGSNDLEGWVPIVVGSTTSGNTTEYVLYSSADNSSVPTGNYIIVYSTNGTSGKALTGYDTEKTGGTPANTPTDVTIANNKITSTVNSLIVWTVNSNGSIQNGSNYLQNGSETNLIKNSAVEDIDISVDPGNTGAWRVHLKQYNFLIYSGSNFARSAQDKTGNGGYNIYLFKETTVESTGGTGTESEYAQLSGTATYTITPSTYEDVDALLTQIQSDYTIYTNSSASTDGQEAVAWNDSNVEYSWSPSMNLSQAGTYVLTVTYKDKTLGTITVAVNTTTEGTTTTVPGVYAKLDGTEGISCDMHLASDTIISNLKASSNLKVLVAEDANGTNVTELAMSNSKVLVVKPSSYANTLAGTYYFDVFYDVDGDETADSNEKIGSVPVYVNGEATLAVSPSSATVAVNGTQTLTPAVTVEGVEIPSGEYTITWSTSNSGVATVNNGVVTGVASGNATITATLTKVTVTNKESSSKKDENTLDTPISVRISVTVTEATGPEGTVTDISLSDDTLDIPQNSTEAEVAELLSRIGLNVTYSDGTTVGTLYHLDDSEVTVGAIDTSAAVGSKQEITVSYGGKTTTLEVTITEASSGSDTPSSGNIYTHNFSTTADGMTDTDGYFTISGNETTDGATIDGTTYNQGLKLQSSAGTVSFTADNPGTLTLHVGNCTTVKIDGTAYDVTDGVVVLEGLAAGTHTITKGSGEGRLYYIEYAEENVEPEYSVTITGAESILGGDSTTLTAEMLLGDAAVDGATYEWTVTGAESYSANGDKVTIVVNNAEGNITVKVKATSGENTAEATHTVTVYYVSASVSGADSVYVGDSATYTATVSPNSTFGVTWSVTDGTGSATIDADTGVLTGVTAGTVTVTATVTEIGGSSIGATASKEVTVQDNTYAVTFNDAGINEGVTATLSNYVTVTKNGATMTGEYTLVFTVDGAANDGSYTGEAVDADATHNVVVKLMIGENEVASDEGTLTVYDINFHDNGLWNTVTTNTATVVEGGKLIFTLSGDLAAGYWGFLDNLKLYKADGTQVSITNGDFESGITGWTVTGFSATPTSDANADKNTTNRLSLWISNTDAATGTATFTVTGLEAGDYYFTYDILNGTTGSTVTGTATATEPVKSNVTVTTSASDGNTYQLVTGSYETGVAYVIARYNSSYGMGAFPSASDQKMVAVYALSQYGTDTSATYTLETAYHYYIDSEGRIYYQNESGTKYYVQFTEASSSGLKLTTTEADASKFTISIDDDGVATFMTSVGSSTRYLQVDSGGGKTNSGAKEIAMYKLVSEAGDGEATEYLVEATAQNITVEAGSSVDPVVTLTGKDMEGNTVTVTGTLSYTPGNTGIAVYENGKIKGVSAGSTSVTATLTNVSINGKTGAINEGATISATFNVTVTPAPVSKDEWIHNVTTDGVTDSDGFYDISKGSGNASTSDTSRTYGDLSFDTAIKIESSTEIAFTAPNDGTFTMIFRTSDAGKGININGTSHAIGEDGVLTIDVEAGKTYTVTKDDSVYVFYMEYASALVDGLTLTEPGTIYMYMKDAASSAATHVMEYVVRHGEADVTNDSSAYSIAWTSDNESVATVSGGTVSGIKPGTANITATVTMADGTQYTATVPVTVEGATLGTTDELNLMVDVDSKKTGAIVSNVNAGGAATDVFTVGYLSSDEKVATVDANGTVTAVGVGSATIYTYLKTVNGHDVYTGTPTVDTLPEQYATTKVTVTQKEITDAYLNSYDYIIQQGSAKTALYDLLEYKADVTGSVHGEEGVKLTITYNTGETIVAKFVDANGDGIDDNYAANGYGLQIDLDSIDLTQPGIQFATVTYTDEKKNELFRDTIWIHVVGFDPSKFDGTMTWEGNISYQLDTDGIEPNYEYVIVADRDTANGTGIAFMNPDSQSTGSTAASGNAVTIQTADGVETVTIASDADATAWLFDTYYLNVACPDGKTRTQLNVSNSQRYVGHGEAETQLIHGNVAHVYLETVDAAAGAYYIILGFGEDNAPYYLAYEDGTWHATTTPSTVYLYNKHADIQDYGVHYDLYDKDNAAEITTAELIEGKSYDKLNPVITWGGDGTVAGTAAESYTIVWSSSDPSVATVDQNGKVTALKEGTATITATLYDVDGFDVICNVHNTPYITKAVTVNVITDNATPTLTPSYLEIGQGSMPNLDKVNIEMSYGEGSENNYFVDHNLLNFRMADATNSAGEAVGFDSTTIDTYTVPVDYAGKTYYLTIKVVEDPYAGLDPADSIPGYPDAGSVRMDKVAEAVLDFTTTGVTKIELTAAGVSTKNSVDVILIVDVSNSMSWDINNSSNSTDATRIPTDGVDGVTKLDTAMDVADQFAKILLTVPGGDNTITFVTFAGQNGTTDSYVDSVRTPMVGVSDYSIASGVFAATEFTALTKDGDSVKCTLNIGGYTGNGYGEDSVSGTNRGNTNYDFAFGQAIDAVADLKAQYAANNNGASYDDSGRQIQVVFMTDGAPSHYNNKKANGSADTLWSGSGKYTQDSDVTADSWLVHMKNYNELATDLFALADGFYVVGFDMDAGGFAKMQWGVADMTRVLEGLVKNTALPVETADDNAALTTYFNNLAQALAYPGTNAMVTDRIGNNFTLFSGAHMYSDDITTPDKDGKVIMSEATLTAMQGMSFPITVASYRLVVFADIGTELEVINEDGTTSTVTVTEDHLGLRVAGEDNVDILETITFSADGTQAFSSVLGADNNIMVDDLDKMVRTIDASTFIYTATLSPIKDADGNVTGYHADQENFVWKIDTIEDHELSMSYYAYLEGSLDNPRETVAGSYATNEYAYLEYIDVYGKYVKRYYGVPQIAWGAGNVTVRFFLVNADGQYVNRAGVIFTNPANRIFLDGRAQYQAELNNKVSFTAADALLQAGLAGSNILYDVSAAATVTNSTTLDQGSVAWTKNGSLTNINNLLTYTDSSNGYFTSVVIDIPVVMTDLGESEQKMSDTTVVIDYSNSVQWDALSEAERAYDGVVYEGVQYNIELVGFAKYNSSADLKDYVQEAGWPTTYATSYGTYEVVSGTDQIKFTPNAMLNGTDHVFAVFKFENLDKSNIGENGQNMEYYYMYKQVNVVPATVVHYETTGTMGAAFQSNINGAAWSVQSIAASVAGAAQSNKNENYGADTSYNGCVNFAGGSSLFVENTDSSAARPSVKFTFTGTGIDIISKTDPNQGRIKMTLTGKNTGTKKSVMVLNKGVDNLYQIPVISVEGLPFDTYEVEIIVYSKTSAYGGQFYLDAINVYGSAQEAEVIGSNAAGDITVGDMYEAAGESKPQIVEIRDILLGNNNFGDITASGVQGAVYIDGNGNLGDTSTNFNNYDKIGPNNEVYLSNNQAVAFKLRVEDLAKLPTTLDIGLKSVNGSAAKAVIYVYQDGKTDTVPAEYTISTSTAMFYDILGGEDIKTFLGENNEFYVVIANKGTGTLSVTDLKVGYGAAKGNVETVVDITVGSLTQETLNQSAQVVSAAIANMNTETNTAIAYAMYTTTIVVVTGQDAKSIVIEDSEGNEIAVNASYVDSDNGARRWRVLVRFNEVGTDTYTIYGIGTDGSRHDTFQQITVDVQLFAPATTN